MSQEAPTATSIDWHDCAAVAGSSACAPSVRTSDERAHNFVIVVDDGSGARVKESDGSDPRAE
jgi:hypothetical protein